MVTPGIGGKVPREVNGRVAPACSLYGCSACLRSRGADLTFAIGMYTYNSTLPIQMETLGGYVNVNAPGDICSEDAYIGPSIFVKITLNWQVTGTPVT
jgi:hypothetical protein